MAGTPHTAEDRRTKYQCMVRWCVEHDKHITAKPYIDDVLAGTL